MRNVIITLFSIAVLCLAASHVGPASAYPPSSITGEADSIVTQNTIKSTICVANYTAGVRAVTESEKKFVLERDHQTRVGCCEVDHFLSLEIGGTNNKDTNLWAEPYSGKYGAREKDKVETALHRLICGGAMTLKDAQSCILADWVACGRRIKVLDN